MGMERLGRLIALPLVMLALALQGFATAAAAAMPRDAFGQPICSAHLFSHGSQGQTPAHDCCADACALTGLGAPPAEPPTLTRSAAPGEAIAWLSPSDPTARATAP